MDFSTQFSTWIDFFGSLFSKIISFLSSVIIAPNVSLLSLSIGLSLFALAIRLLVGLFGGGSDR